MKTFKLSTLLFALLAIATFTTSCSKDDDTQAPKEQSGLVGTWDVMGGEAQVYVDGTKIVVDLETNGIIRFNDDKSGDMDFTIDFAGEHERIEGDFTWEKSGFELLLTSDGETERWAIINDNDTSMTIQYTVKTTSGDVEFTMDFRKK